MTQTTQKCEIIPIPACIPRNNKKIMSYYSTASSNVNCLLTAISKEETCQT